MSKADHYRAYAERCEAHATALPEGVLADIAAIWLNIAQQYRFLERLERSADEEWPTVPLKEKAASIGGL